MADCIVRATAANANIRAFAIQSTELAEEARNLHHTTPVVTAALGRLLSAGAMMASMMKNEEDKLTLTIKGDGPVRQLTVTADGAGNVKGFPEEPFVILPPKRPGKLDVGRAVGRGSLLVSMDLGLREPYNGQVELQTGEIGDDLAYYFAKSEQTPSAVGLGVKVAQDQHVEVAGGFILQLMPGAPEEVIAALEERVARVTQVTSLLEETGGPTELLESILGDLGLEITETLPVRWHCGCSEEYIARALATLQTKDLKEMIEAGEDIEVKCHFCNSAYTYSPAQLTKILGRRYAALADKIFQADSQVEVPDKLRAAAAVLQAADAEGKAIDAQVPADAEGEGAESAEGADPQPSDGKED